jgi:hypothetical protein
MKKILLSMLAEWGLGIIILIVLYGLVKISPALVVFLLPVACAYWVISSAIKSGETLFIRKSYSASQKQMFSLAIATWTYGISMLPITAAAVLLKLQNSGIFWISVLLSFILFYLSLLMLNPVIQKASKKNTI